MSFKDHFEQKLLNEAAEEDRKYPLASKQETGAYGGDINWKGKIIYMSPDKFLRLARPLPENMVNSQSIQNLRQRMTENLPIDPLVLTVDMEKKKVTGHEGRHRARVAKEFGIKEVPVLIFTGSSYARTPEWTPEQHKEVEGAVDFKPEI